MAYSGTIQSSSIDASGNVKIVVNYSDGTSIIPVTVIGDVTMDTTALSAAIVTEGKRWKSALDRMTLSRNLTSNGTVNPLAQYNGTVIAVP